MKVAFVHVPTSEGFVLEKGSVNNLFFATFLKEVPIALGALGNNYYIDPISTSPIPTTP